MGDDRDEFAWSGFNTGALLDWLSPMEPDRASGWLRLLNNKKGWLYRDSNGTITFEQYNG